MLFIFGRLLVSGSAVALRAAQGPDMYSGPEKTCEMSVDRWCSLTQPYFGISLVGLGASSYSIPSLVFFFPYLILSLCTSPPFPRSIRGCILTSICCFPAISWLVVVFLLGLSGSYAQMVCNGFASVIRLRYSQAESNERPKAIFFFFFFYFYFCKLSCRLHPVRPFVFTHLGCTLWS